MFKRLKYKVLGSCDSVTTCHCCGRENLKKTIALDDYEGNIIYLGETCAAKFMEMKVTEFKKEYTNSIKQLRQEKEKFINTHPLTKQINEEVQEINKKGLSFKERQELGYIKKWAELTSIVYNEVNSIYQFV